MKCIKHVNQIITTNASYSILSKSEFPNLLYPHTRAQNTNPSPSTIEKTFCLCKLVQNEVFSNISDQTKMMPLNSYGLTNGLKLK